MAIEQRDTVDGIDGVSANKLDDVSNKFIDWRQLLGPFECR